VLVVRLLVVEEQPVVVHRRVVLVREVVGIRLLVLLVVVEQLDHLHLWGHSKRGCFPLPVAPPLLLTSFIKKEKRTTFI
jgi:hypothetical protein